MTNTAENLNSIGVELYALIPIVFLLEVELTFFSHEGTIDIELSLLLGKNKKNTSYKGIFNIELFP